MSQKKKKGTMGAMRSSFTGLVRGKSNDRTGARFWRLLGGLFAAALVSYFLITFR